MTHHNKRYLSHANIRNLEKCKIIKSLETSFSNQINKKSIYTKLCKRHQKTMHYMNTNGKYYYHIIRNPRRFDLQMGNFQSWKVFFQKKSVRFLKMYYNQYDIDLSEKKQGIVLYHLEHSERGLSFIKDIEISGYILTDFADLLIDKTTIAIQKQRAKLNIELKAWDHNAEDLIWPETPIIKRSTNSVYFVNRCNNADNLVEPITNLSLFHNLQKLEFWIRLHPKNDFDLLIQLRDCTLLKELRLRIDFDGDLEGVSRKFLKNIKFPETLTFLNLTLSGLRLGWVGEMPRVKDLEEDKTCLEFFDELEKLQDLTTFQIGLHDLKINFSSIFINIIRRLESIKELSVIMGITKFVFKDADKYPILDFGFWTRRLPKIFSQLKSISMELPCVYLEEVDSSSADVLQNLQTISLGYRILSKEKGCPKLNTLLSMLNPNGIVNIFLGESNAQNEADFKNRFEMLTKLNSLQVLTLAVTPNNQFSRELFEYFCWCLARMQHLRRVSCRLEKANIEEKDWRYKLLKVFNGIKHLNSGYVSSKSGIIDFER